MDKVTTEALKSVAEFKVAETRGEYSKHSVHSVLKYDLIGKIAEGAQLTRRTTADILKGNPVKDKLHLDIFTAGKTKQDFSKAVDKLKRHIYDYVITDSGIEREFVKELDTCTEVIVYAKLPRGFLILTPVGDYNPDWAIPFKEGMVKHVYVLAVKTKGSMSSMEINEIEKNLNQMRAQVLRRNQPEIRR